MRILLSGVPAFGHLLPLAPLARAAAEAGHETALLTSSGMAEGVAPNFPGVPVLAGGPMAEEVFAEVGRRTGNPDAAGNPTPEAVAEFFAGARVDLSTEQALASARGWRPDLVLAEATDFVGPLVAAALGVPWSVVAMGPAVPPEFTAPMLALAAERYSARGLAPTPPRHHLDPVPAALQTPGWERPEGHLPVRPEPPHRTVPGWVPPVFEDGAGKARVLLSLGTVFSRPEVLEEVLRGIDPDAVDVVANLPTGALPADRPGVRFVPFASMRQLLEGADAAVVAGGSGTVLSAVSAGVPLVVLPQGADQFSNAQRVADAGLGVAVQSADRVGGALAAVLGGPSYAATARRLAEEVAAMPDAGAAIDVLVAEVAATHR
ncbi:glycosyltransferase [Kineococcus sp. T13]|uniref:glycosyltransferase n=1 Tax=Kineococcus vitellinus TaxID=2696565 RepID=UPI001411C452|nr:glycosyltransferase [Kineococcus vitellinus]NAZ77678.1 glycosyltransferase [Kineococcus vitellinus]